MKLVKSLLLGSAAGIAAVAGAQAADLPSRKAAPVEYVRVCSAYGAGFFYIPGTDTCLRVGGRVRAEYTVGTRFGNAQDAYGTRARGRLNVDARTATAYGTLRTFFRYELTNSS
ncbi:MAG TPA: porin, partial [Bosea sp. (in: a-proteobacteria)]|nr:porin [Bosea sp. (in: a-proteobacteria)]